MLDNLPFDPRLLAGLQTILSECAEPAAEITTVPPQEPPAASSPAEDQPGTDPEPVTPGKDGGRDAGGKFTKGNFGGPGNPFARQTAGFRKAIHAAVTEADLELVAKKLVEKAKEGDVAAMKLLLSYTVGKPGEAVNPDMLDVHEVQSFRAQMMNPAEISPVLQGVSAELAAFVLRFVVPALDETQRQLVLDKVAAQDRKAAEKNEKKHSRNGIRERREETAADEDAPESHRQQRDQTAGEHAEAGAGRHTESTRNGREPSRNGGEGEKQYDPDLIQYGWQHYQDLASEWKKERDRKRKRKKKKKKRKS